MKLINEKVLHHIKGGSIYKPNKPSAVGYSPENLIPPPVKDSQG
ncbi:hypothetical protein [Pseudoalteromonas sp. MMG012]|nr:hypothetical protein [Pseudoalteromonas sp. MMG012]